jgi:hypothetical protein
MNRSLHGAAIGVVLHGLACAPTTAQVEPAVPAAPAGESRVILGGKFLAVAPKDSVIKHGSHSVMEAPTSQLVEDNLWVERGGFRFVARNRELFVKCNPDFLAQASDIVTQIEGAPAKGTYRTETLRVGEARLPVVSLTLTPPLRTGGTTYIGDAIVCHPQGMLAVMVFATNVAPDQDLRPAVSLRDQIVSSLSVGPRASRLEKRTERFEGFALDVPEGLLFYEDQGPDFVVYRLRQVVELGKPPRSALLYFGRFPSPVDGTEKVPGTLLGQSIMWARDPKAPFVLSHLTKLDDGSSLHVILEGESSEGLRVLTQIVQSLRRDPGAK